MASFVPHDFDELPYPQLKNFVLSIAKIESAALKNNPLGDSTIRHNPVLTPKIKTKKDLGLIFVCAGLAGNGTKYLADKGFEETFIQQLDHLVSLGKAPSAHYVFIDAWTFWGGSQFINSRGVGNYEDYVVKELYPILLHSLSVDPLKVAIMGQSSGGYGALHLASKYPQFFPFCGSLAPDCYFEASLLPDFFKAAPFLREHDNYLALKKIHGDKALLKQRDGFSILNAIAMACCYSTGLSANKIDWPIDLSTGKLNAKIWKTWKLKDPVHFLSARMKKVKKLKALYLEVGHRDEFHLQMGVRQIHALFKKNGFKHHYSEFLGGHFDYHDRYPLFWEWLAQKWKS